MKRLLAVALLPLLILLPLTLQAEPDDDTASKLKLVEELMRRLEDAEAEAEPEVTFERRGNTVLRVYNLADLTVRLTNFIGPNLLLRPAGAEVDEDAPLFGKAEEGEMIFGGVEDIMDLLVQNVRPEVWTMDGHSMTPSGPYALVVVAEPDVHAEVAEYIRGLQRSAGRMITVELRVLKAKPGADPAFPSGSKAVSLSKAEGLALLARAEAGRSVAIAHSARATGYSGQRFGLHRGRQQAFVQDYDVEVAQNSMISDPIVGVFQTGLAFDVRPIARGEELVMLHLKAQLSTLAEELRTVETGSGPAGVPALAYVRFATSVTVPDGGFALIGGGSGPDRGRWALLASARTQRVVSESKGGGR